ncbi:response regulator [Sphingobacterium sp.]|uniref:response regulator n=1 Tax=Sphingobacterium sp. TaxID=341027 RepID=UPI00289944E9|nr:response regulator [Sphingobacterium sp.]
MLKSKILICDDSIQYLRMLQMVLGTMTGAEVFTEREAKNIYKRLIEQEYDLLIMDPCMMNMTCEKLIAEIKKEKRLQHLSILCLSLDNNAENIANKAGADNFLSKLGDLSVLISLVNDALRNKD